LRIGSYFSTVTHLSNRFAVVISIGDELTSGQRLDTNSQWLSLRLGELGITVQAHQTIGDYLEPMKTAFQLAADRSQVVLVTGGLGPTQDDLTRQALAEAFGVELYFHAPSWEDIRRRFLSRSTVAPQSNRLQAMFPAGSQPIPNEHGTAPGILWKIEGPTHETLFFCMPGVPVEMREMYVAGVLPVLETLLDGQRQFIIQRVIKTFGAGESHVESLLPNLIVRGNDPQVGITASHATISLRLQTTAASRELGEAKLQPVVETIYQCLGSLVFAEGDVELEDVVVAKFEELQQRMVVVEWGTRGLVAQRLAEAYARRADGAGDRVPMLCGAVILTHWDAVTRWLAPDVIYSQSETPTLSQVVQDLARVAAERFQADLAVASGPLPDAVDGSDLAFEIATRRNSPSDVQQTSAQFSVLGHPSLWRPRAAKQVLNHLRLLEDASR
jgi:nicotinamide-nucleotide amidase